MAFLDIILPPRGVNQAVFTQPLFLTSSCDAELHVTNKLGGVWKFPLLLSATTAAPDDVITIEGEGLNVATQIGFRLTSMLKYVSCISLYFNSLPHVSYCLFP